MSVQESWFVEQTLKNLGALCLQYLGGEIRQAQLRKQIRLDFLVGRTYEEVAQLYWQNKQSPPEVRPNSESERELRQDNAFRTDFWRTWGEPLTDLLRQCWDLELSARRAKTLSDRLWKRLTRYWSQCCRTAGRSFGSALRVWSGQAKQAVENGSDCERNPSQPQPNDLTFAEEGELSAEDVVTLALYDLLTTAILGDYVLRSVERPPRLVQSPSLPRRWFWLGRTYWNAIPPELFEDTKWRTFWSNWLRLDQCLLAETNTLGLVRDRIRKLPADQREQVAELARNVAERSGLRRAAVARGRPLEELFFLAVG